MGIPRRPPNLGVGGVATGAVTSKLRPEGHKIIGWETGVQVGFNSLGESLRMTSGQRSEKAQVRLSQEWTAIHTPMSGPDFGAQNLTLKAFPWFPFLDSAN